MAKDFAKLFHVDGIGQVLITRDFDQYDEKEIIVFRIPDCEDASLTMNLSMESGAAADIIFEQITTPEQAAGAVKALVEARDQILGQA